MLAVPSSSQIELKYDQYAARLNPVHIMTKVMILNKKNLEQIWKLISMASHQKNKSGTKCWLTCLFNLKSATILSNGGKPKNVIKFKRSSNEGLGSQIRCWMIWMNPIINYGTPFSNINLLLSLRWDEHSGVVFLQSSFSPDVSRHKSSWVDQKIYGISVV